MANVLLTIVMPQDGRGRFGLIPPHVLLPIGRPKRSECVQLFGIADYGYGYGTGPRRHIKIDGF